MPNRHDSIVLSLRKSIETSRRCSAPYRHWFLRQCLPQEVVDELLALPFEAPTLGGLSGKRELHNPTRQYFDSINRGRFSICDQFCRALRDPELVELIALHFGVGLHGTYLRVEYAQDVDGFWLEPHTDLGVKRFTMLVYLSKEVKHETLGTDIYSVDKRHYSRAPFESNFAMIFVPSAITYHGFEQREIEGVRTSLVVNFVTSEWRARDQLAFPEEPLVLASETGAMPCAGSVSHS